MPTQIALLRGINLVKRNRIAMADLRDLVEGLGHTDARTYLQSGNVVFDSTTAAAKTAAAIERAINKEYGYDVAVVVRTPAQMRKTIEANPFPDGESEPKLLHVRFCAKAPAKKARDEFDPVDYEPERFEFKGADLYSWHPGGVQKSKLARGLNDERLGVVSTDRNWSSVLAIADLAED